MANICPDFKWLDFRISDYIRYLDHLQPILFSTIQNPSSTHLNVYVMPVIRIPTEEYKMSNGILKTIPGH